MDPKLVDIIHRMDNRFKGAGLEDLSSLPDAIEKRGRNVSKLLLYSSIIPHLGSFKGCPRTRAL